LESSEELYDIELRDIEKYLKHTILHSRPNECCEKEMLHKDLDKGDKYQE